MKFLRLSELDLAPEYNASLTDNKKDFVLDEVHTRVRFVQSIETVLPTITGAVNHAVANGADPIDFTAGVTAQDANGVDLTGDIVITGDDLVDYDVADDYDVTYSVTDAYGDEQEVTIVVTVAAQ